MHDTISDTSKRAAATRHKPDVKRQAGALLARFWGVRGSHPVVGSGGSRVGVNTSCVELRWGRHVVLLDAGSGLIPLGERLGGEWRERRVADPSVSVLFTHAHHDHLCGLPFFAPLFTPEARVHLLGPDLAGMRFPDILHGYMRSPYFPVDLADVPAHCSVRTVAGGTRLVWAPDADGPVIWGSSAAVPESSLVVDVFHARAHPRDGTLVYRATAGGRSLAFATDMEMDGAASELERGFVRFVRGVDVLIHDAQYSAADYDGPSPRRGFGHSTPDMAGRIARTAEAGELVLFHTDPDYGDGEVTALEVAARAVFPRARAAREGAEIWLDAAGVRHV
ncbi:MAG: MBL fold metallo-hydrolase [Ktedonobacterales bacterium]